MKTARLFTLALAAFAFAACSQDDSVTENVRKANITLHAPEFTTDWSRAQDAASGKGFRIKHELDEKTGMKFSWTQGDITGVFAENSEQQLPLKMADGQDAAAKVEFVREDYQLAKGVTYVAYYPVVDRLLQEPNIEVSYLDQKQDGNHSYAHLAKKDYMVSDPVTVEQTNTADFHFHHQGAILRLLIDMPEADTYTSVTLDARAEDGTTRTPAFTTRATLNLFDRNEVIEKAATSDHMTLTFKDGSASTTATDKQLEAWLMISPADFTTNKLIVTVKSATGKDDVVYTVSPGKNFVKGKAYQIKVPGEGAEDIFGLKWAEANTRSWIDAVTYNNNAYFHSYIPDVPLKEQGIELIYDNGRTVFTNLENRNVYHYQWDRDFGYVASDAAYDQAYTRLPNSANTPNWLGNHYGYSETYYNSMDEVYEYSDYFIYPPYRNDYCSVQRTNWANRMDTYGFSAAPKGFHIPTLAEWNTLRPENENKVYTYASTGIDVDGGTAYPFFVKNEDGNTIVWSMWETDNKRYLDVRNVPGTYTSENLNAAVLGSCKRPLQLPADGYRTNNGTLQWQLRGLYWASDSPDATSGTSYAFSFTINPSARTISTTTGTQPRKYAFSIRCIHDK